MKKFNVEDKFILDGKKVVKASGLYQWATWFESACNNDGRRVAKTQVGPFWISTVFLGLDHSFGSGPSLFFETMVFEKPSEEKKLGESLDMYRYTTWKQAEAGHKKMIAKYKIIVASLVKK